MAARITGLRYKAQPIFAQPPPHYRPLQAGGGHWKYIPSGGGGDNVEVAGYDEPIDKKYLSQLGGLIVEDTDEDGNPTYFTDNADALRAALAAAAALEEQEAAAAAAEPEAAEPPRYP